MNSKTKKTAFLGVMTSFALVLSYIELLLPPVYAALPAIKIGLANLVIVFLLYKFSLKEAAMVSAVRILLVALLFGNAMTLLYSLSGAALSLGIMTLLKKFDRFSTLGVSIAGAVSHNIGQIIVAVLILSTAEIVYYLPVLLITGTVSGTVIGILASIIINLNNKYLKL